MKMMTKAIEKKIPAIYSNEDVPTYAKKAAVKFFTPWSNWTWYAFEGEKNEDGDWEFFGLVVGMEKEYGYFTLSELMSVRGPAGLKIERDRGFEDRVVPDRDLPEWVLAEKRKAEMKAAIKRDAGVDVEVI